jgi:glyoxylase-like metal-dependent hydrolase (beta-lactamase superfamily II)
MKRVTIIPPHEITLFGLRITIFKKEGKGYTRQATGREFITDFNEGARRISGVIPGLPAPAAQFEDILAACRELDRQDRAGKLIQLTLKRVNICRERELRSCNQEEDTRMQACLVVLALGFAMPPWFLSDARAQQGGRDAASPSPYPVVQGKTYKFEKIADGVYLATGGGGSNDIIIVNDADLMIVDDGSTPAAARALEDDVKLLTDRPVRYVVNTHFHYDHTDGNSVFPPNVDIIAHEYVRTAILTFDILNREPYRTSQGTRVPRLLDTLRQQIADEKDVSKKAALEKQLVAAQTSLEQLKEIKPTPPTVTYTSKMVLFKGQREIQLLFLGRGHTGGDTVVFLPKERIVCTGDLMETGIAYMGDAFFDEWVATLENLKKLDFTLVLPGHGVPFSDKAHITGFQSYLTDLTNQVTNLRKQGVSAEDAAQRVDLTSHQKDFPQIQRPGADLRGIRHFYEWMDTRAE